MTYIVNSFSEAKMNFLNAVLLCYFMMFVVNAAGKYNIFFLESQLNFVEISEAKLFYLFNFSY